MPLRKRLKEGGFLCLAGLSAYLLMALLTYTSADPGWNYVGPRADVANIGGMIGAWLASVLLSLIGNMAFGLPCIMLWSGWRMFLERHQDTVGWQLNLVRACGLILTLVGATALSTLHVPFGQGWPAGPGGILGQSLSAAAVGLFNPAGASLLLAAATLIGFTFFTGLSWVWVMQSLADLAVLMYQRLLTRLRQLPDCWHARRAQQTRRVVRLAEQQRIAHKTPPVISLPPVTPDPQTENRLQAEKQFELLEPILPQALPELSLLDAPQIQEQQVSEEHLQALSEQVERRLADFGVTAEVVAVRPGPVVTVFELRLSAGTKASKVTGIARDLARALAVMSVRVVEIIPGKPVIGLEIPNPQREIVYLSEILQAEVYARAKSPLTLSLGKDIAGQPVVADLAKMPHLLIAGTTGSGKSVAINTMILSLLYKATPQQVRMIMIDPKMLELSVYEGIPHLLTPVVTDMGEAANALRWCVAEMERRYQLMAALGVRNITGFNKKLAEAEAAGEPLKDPLFHAEQNPITGEIPEQPILAELPYIVIIIDELADMMMVVGKKVEELIARLAQKARAAGVHLLLATQRPSVDVITGLIKANIPTRIAFQVSSRIDSRTILDQMGAEHLLGHGDMLYLPPGTSIPQRAHGAFVDDHEVHQVVHYLQQTGQPDYIADITQDPSEAIPGLSAEAAGIDVEDADPLFDQAVQIVTETRRASISSVQRRLKVGYNRAARLVEEMERIGIVSGPDHKGNRTVLAPGPMGE
ncbi:MAG: DNA translocase FtsK 4TM domain-containing protein [Pseudomonadota bacterium]